MYVMKLGEEQSNSLKSIVDFFLFLFFVSFLWRGRTLLGEGLACSQNKSIIADLVLMI